MDSIGTAAKTALQRTAESRETSRTTPPSLPARLPASGPPAPDRLCDATLPRLICWKPDRGPYELVRALSDNERAKLQVREVDLAHALAPFADDQDKMVRLAISGMFTGFRFMRQQGESVSAAVGITLAVLREFPYWAITGGCMKIIRGEADLDRRYAPNDSEIHAVVAGVVAEHRRNLETVRGLLKAEVARRDPPKRSGTATKQYPPSGHLASVPPGDGNHAQRVAADLAARKTRNAEREVGT